MALDPGTPTADVPENGLPRNLRKAPALFVLLLAGATNGCSHKVVAPLVTNQRPVIRLTSAPASPTGRYDYSYTMHWVGFDPDGEVDHFEYTVDPPGPTPLKPEPDTLWVSTLSNDQQFSFTSTV